VHNTEHGKDRKMARYRLDNCPSRLLSMWPNPQKMYGKVSISYLNCYYVGPCRSLTRKSVKFSRHRSHPYKTST